MPYLIPATANYFGFAPASNAVGETQVNPYMVTSSEGAIYAGDLCTLTAKGSVQSTGFGAAITGPCVGVAANSLAANAGSSAARLDATSSQVILIYDNPAQVFYGCDTSSGTINSTMINKSFSVLATGPTSGSTALQNIGRSIQAISGITGSSAGAIRVMGLHPVEQSVWATAATGAAAVRKFLFVIANHVHAAGAPTGGAVTT